MSTENSDKISMPSANETAQALMEREYKLKKILSAGGELSTDLQGRFRILFPRIGITNWDFGATIEEAFDNIPDSNDRPNKTYQATI